MEFWLEMELPLSLEKRKVKTAARAPIITPKKKKKLLRRQILKILGGISED